MSENIENLVNDEPRPTGLAKYYPIYLNGVAYQYFKTMGFTRNSSVTTHETESGKQEDVIYRKGRRTIPITVTCLQPLVAQLVALDNLDEFEARIYNPVIDDYDRMDVRVAPNSMTYSLKTKSERLNSVNGVWNVSFTLEEF